MANESGWNEWVPQGPSGKFEKYATRVVVIVGVSKSKSSKGRIYLTDAVLKYLGNPKFVKILTRGNNIALMSHNTNSGAYAVSKKTVKGATPFLSCGAFIDQFKHEGHTLIQGVYEAHVETGKVVFDVLQSPSRF